MSIAILTDQAEVTVHGLIKMEEQEIILKMTL